MLFAWLAVLLAIPSPIGRALYAPAALALSRDERTLLVGDDDAVLFLDAETFQANTPPARFDEPVIGLLEVAGGVLVELASGRCTLWSRSQSRSLTAEPDCSLLESKKEKIIEAQKEVLAVETAEISSERARPSAFVFESRTGEVQARGIEDAVLGKRRLYYVTTDHSLVSYDLQTRREHKRVGGTGLEGVKRVVWLDETSFAALTAGGTVIFTLRPGIGIARTLQDVGSVRDIAAAGPGRWLSVSSSGLVELHDVAKSTPIASVCVAPDLCTLPSFKQRRIEFQSSTAVVFDGRDGDIRVELSVNRETLSVAGSAPFESPDDRQERTATTLRDGTVLWVKARGKRSDFLGVAFKNETLHTREGTQTERFGSFLSLSPGERFIAVASRATLHRGEAKYLELIGPLEIWRTGDFIKTFAGKKRPPSPPPPPPPKIEPEPPATLRTKACVSCHQVSGASVGPKIANSWGSKRIMTNGEEVIFDRAYFIESVRLPKARLVRGFPPAMPEWYASLTEAEIESLLQEWISLSENRVKPEDSKRE